MYKLKTDSIKGHAKYYLLLALITLTSCSSTVIVKKCKELQNDVWECKEI